MLLCSKKQAAQPKSIDELLATEVPTALGTTMPLSELVTVEERNNVKYTCS